MADNFSVTKDSIQLPYRRFLADSAAGLTLILLAIATYYLPVITDVPVRRLWLDHLAIEGLASVGPEIKVFVCLLLVLLATPIGFAVNAISWLLIDYSICVTERRYFRWSRNDGRIFPLWDVTEARFGKRLNEYFCLTEANFNVAGWFFRDVLEAYASDRFESQTHIKGLVVFLRNVALFMIALAFVSLAFGLGLSWSLAWWPLLLAATIFLLVARWDALELDEHNRRRRINRIVAFVVVVASAFNLYYAGWSHALRSIVFAFVAAVLIVVIGMIEYYYHDAILLHAYFVCVEHEVKTKASDRENGHFLAIGEELIRKIAERARQNTVKSRNDAVG